MKGETTPQDPGAAASRAAPGLSPVGAVVRQHDRDRYRTALFAPFDRHEALFALYAFNYEIARVRESVTQPMLGQIRLQWWREVVAAAYAGMPPRQHIVAAPLAAVIREHVLGRGHFDRLIDAREQDLADEPPATLSALEQYAEATAATLICLAVEILGNGDPHPDPPPLAGEGGPPGHAPVLTLPRKRGREGWGAAGTAADHVGIAYALAGLLRAMPFHARTGRCYIPHELAADAGVDPNDYAGSRPSPALRHAVETIADAAAGHLRMAREHRAALPRAALPALLPAVVADHTLARLRSAGWNPFDPRVAMPDPLLPWRLAGAMLRRRF